MKNSLSLGFSLPLVLLVVSYCLTYEVRQVRVIALTVFTREQDRKEAIDAGLNDHLAKPVNAAALLRKVAQVAASVR